MGHGVAQRDPLVKRGEDAEFHPSSQDAESAVSMAILGVGWHSWCPARQRGAVLGRRLRAGEAGGLQYTGNSSASSLGVALIGAIVLTGLTSALVMPSSPTSGSGPRAPRRWESPSR